MLGACPASFFSHSSPSLTCGVRKGCVADRTSQSNAGELLSTASGAFAGPLHT